MCRYIVYALYLFSFSPFFCSFDSFELNLERRDTRGYLLCALNVVGSINPNANYLYRIVAISNHRQIVVLMYAQKHANECS